MVAWKDRTLYDRITDRWQELEGKYSTLNTNREQIIRIFRSDEQPENDSEGSTNSGSTGGGGKDMDLLGQNIYNGSGAWYSKSMATGFQGNLVSKNIVWIRYQMEQFSLRTIDELDIWLQDVKVYMNEVYQRSNFYDVQPQFTLDGITTGSPVMFGESVESSGRTMWMPQYYKNVRLYYDKFNEVNGCIVRDKKWTAKQIHDTFIGDDPDGTKATEKLTMSVNNALKAGKLNQEFTVYRAVFKVDDQIWDGSGNDAFKKPAGDWTWLSVYFLEITDQDASKKNKPLNDNMGYFSQPFVNWDFDKKPWEAASRTPAWYAIWDNMGLQQVHKNLLENAQLMNRPPVIAMDTMKGNMHLSPEGQMYVGKQEYDRPPKSLDLIGSLNIPSEIIEIYDEALQRWFFIDKFQMFSQLARQNKQPVTATQIFQMAGEKATLLSPAIETHSKYLSVADARMVDIEARAGRGPFDPDTMANITDIILSNATENVVTIGIQPTFVSPLAQAQKLTQALEPITTGIALVRESGLLDMEPDLKHGLRLKGTMDKMLEAVDFPASEIVPTEEYDEIVAGINEQRAAQLQQENQIELMKASKALQGPVDETSVIEQVKEAV
jgi:hypothetical protein